MTANYADGTLSALLQEGAGITISPGSLAFANLDLATTSAKQTVTLKNTGSAPLVISAIDASGDFAQTNTCGNTVAPGASCTISVTFSPTAIDTRTGAITIYDNAPHGPHVVNLTGTGMGPAVSFSTSAMSVGGQVVGTTSGAHTITLTNSGNMALTITGMTISPSSFSETNTCGSSLAAGASCTITVTFTPTTAGASSGMLSITDNAPGSPHEVMLTGMGQDFTIGPYNLSQTIPAGVTAPYDLKVAPEGGFNQSVSLACSGEPAQSTCSVTPASATLDGLNPAVITLRVVTQGASSAPPISHARPHGWPPALTLSGLLGAMLLLILRAGTMGGKARSVAISPARLRPRVLAPLGALLLLTIAWIACGGGSAFVFTPPSGGTPTGNYVITVTATSGHLSHAVTVKLTVE